MTGYTLQDNFFGRCFGSNFLAPSLSLSLHTRIRCGHNFSTAVYCILMRCCAGQYVQLYRYAIEINCVSAYHRCWSIAYVPYVYRVEMETMCMLLSLSWPPLPSQRVNYVEFMLTVHLIGIARNQCQCFTSRSHSSAVFFYIFFSFLSFSASPDSWPIHTRVYGNNL